MNRGYLILLEGVDNVGKTTQIDLISKFLDDIFVSNIVLKSPDRTSKTGSIIDQVLKGDIQMSPQTKHMLFSTNRWEAQDLIIKTLEAGTCVLMDRYSYSGIAYSCALGLSLKWCKSTEVGMVKPDLIFYFDANGKIYPGDFEIYDIDKFQANVANWYEIILCNEHDKDNINNIHIIDASRPIDNINVDISVLLLNFILSKTNFYNDKITYFDENFIQ